MDFRQEADEILKAAAQTIDRPFHHHVELTPDCSLVERIKGRPLVSALSAADAVVLIHLDDLPTCPIGNGLQLTLLVSCGLVESGYPKIENRALHGESSLFVHKPLYCSYEKSSLLKTCDLSAFL